MRFSFLSWLHGRFLRFVNPFQKTLGEQNYIILLSVLVGLLSGVAGALMKAVEHGVRSLVRLIPDAPWAVWVLPATPALGVFFCIFVTQVIMRGRYERGLAGVIMSVKNRTGTLPLHKVFSHIVTCGVSVGTGVSAGMEAPVAQTGAAIGSNVARSLLLNHENRILLLACGGAAGISAMFNTPVAGAFFAMEILLPKTSSAIPAIIPLILSSATALLVSQQIYPPRPYDFDLLQWNMRALPYYVILGAAAGLVSVFVIKMYTRISKRFGRVRNPWVKGLIGSAILYLAILLFPALRGEGYPFINRLLDEPEALYGASPLAAVFSNPWVFLLLTFLLVFLKAMTSISSLESGADGGIFAPSMFIGAFLGYSISKFIHMAGLVWGGYVSEMNFLAIGMGGVLAGVMHAPLTGIFLIAELTGGYKLFIPLMIVSALSTFVCRKLCTHNVYKTMILFHGGDPDGTRDGDALTRAIPDDLIEKDYLPLAETDSMRSVLNSVMKTHQNVFPVLDRDGRLAGIVTLDDIRHYLLETSLYDVALVFDIMRPPEAVLKPGDTLGRAINLFEKHHETAIPVVRGCAYIGFVTKDRVLDRYRYLIENRPELF
ncbi:MAG: chloride channel protein [Lentisphaeria bacterium]|nr:chloride channel protein [Lentisphaeria bacterium]